MGTEGLVVSQREIRRYELLRQVLEGKLLLARAAETLGVSYRHAKRLKTRVEAAQLRGLVALRMATEGMNRARTRARNQGQMSSFFHGSP